MKKDNYNSIHQYFKRNGASKKVCKFCGATKYLDWALKHGKDYDRNLENYLVLCRSCHLKYDFEVRKNPKPKVSPKLEYRIECQTLENGNIRIIKIAY